MLIANSVIPQGGAMGGKMYEKHLKVFKRQRFSNCGSLIVYENVAL